jgi:hypothetical protein
MACLIVGSKDERIVGSKDERYSAEDCTVVPTYVVKIPIKGLSKYRNMQYSGRPTEETQRDAKIYSCMLLSDYKAPHFRRQ